MKKYTLPELPYDYDSLEPLYSAEMLELHHSKHHAAYVKGANQALAQLKTAREKQDFSMLNQLQKTLAFNISGHILHSIFWQNMSPDGGGDPSRTLTQTLNAEFGTVNNLREQMTEAAKSLQGSGWITLAWEPAGQGLIVEQVYDHQGNIGNGSLPLLVIDCWEHAYYLQYQNDKAKWIDSFWELVNWKDVEQRLATASDLQFAA